MQLSASVVRDNAKLPRRRDTTAYDSINEQHQNKNGAFDEQGDMLGIKNDQVRDIYIYIFREKYK